MEFIQSIMAHDEAVTLGTVVTYDLPVNPLSHILINIIGEHKALDASFVANPFNICDVFKKIEVLYKGSAVYSMTGKDAVAAGVFVNGFETWDVNSQEIENAHWTWTVLVPLTRILYSPVECFPRTTRGELILQITYDNGDNVHYWDDFVVQIETVELPDASPTQFIKQTTLSLTPTASIPFDLSLPIGNPISELVVYQWAVQSGVDVRSAADKMEILVDNKNHFYPESFVESLQNMAGRMRCPPGYWGNHVHKLIDAEAPAQGQYTSAPIPKTVWMQRWLHIPFDIFRNGEYALETAGKSDVTLRFDVVKPGEFRVIPVEVVASAGAV